MSEQLEAKGTIVLNSNQPINSGNGILVPIIPAEDIIDKKVRFTKVDELPDLDHPSSDKTVTLSAANLCDAVGIKKSAIARALHEGHGYPITEMELVQPFKVGDPYLKGELRSSGNGFVSWEVVEEEVNLLSGQVQTEDGLVVLSQALGRINVKPEEIIEFTAVSVKKVPMLENSELKKAA